MVIVACAGNHLRPSVSSHTNRPMEKETRFVTVYWSDIMHMTNTIEVDINEHDEEYMFEIATQFGPKMIGGEIETDSIEIVRGLDL